MTVYVEYVIVDNLVIDSLILLTCQKLSKAQTSKLKLFLSALTGTIIALLSPLLPNIINLVIKPFVAVLMVIIAFKPANIKKLGLFTLLLFLVTFMYGGTMIGLMEILGIEFTLQNGISYVNNFPVGLAILFCAITYIATKNIISYCTKKNKQAEFLYDCQLTNGSNQINITAFLDSGNCIVIDGKPVTIINYKTFNALYPNICITDLLLKKQLPIKNQNYTEIKGLNNMAERILTLKLTP